MDNLIQLNKSGVVCPNCGKTHTVSFSFRWQGEVKKQTEEFVYPCSECEEQLTLPVFVTVKNDEFKIELDTDNLKTKYRKQLDNWFEKYEGNSNLTFENLNNEYKLHENKNISAMLFLYSKLKDKDNIQDLDATAHSYVFFNKKLSEFEKFTEEDVKVAVAHSISIDIERFVVRLNTK